jgi:predicted ArsR family transcriptional regulator
MNRLEAVADPIRLRVLRCLSDTPAATLPELARAAGVHLNTVRPHVLALERAGVLTRERQAPEGRGRPPVQYRLAGDWRPPTTDYLGLAELLAATLARSAPSTLDLRAVGLEWGRWLLGRPGSHDFSEEVPRALEHLGFHARVHDQVLELSACPCTLVLPNRPELLCELAAAVVDGVLAGSGSGLKVGRRAHHPDQRRCALELEVTAA